MNAPGRLLIAFVAAILLGGVFYLYTRPDFLVQMVNELWACF